MQYDHSACYAHGVDMGQACDMSLCARHSLVRNIRRGCTAHSCARALWPSGTALAPRRRPGTLRREYTGHPQNHFEVVNCAKPPAVGWLRKAAEQGHAQAAGTQQMRDKEAGVVGRAAAASEAVLSCWS